VFNTDSQKILLKNIVQNIDFLKLYFKTEGKIDLKNCSIKMFLNHGRKRFLY